MTLLLGGCNAVLGIEEAHEGGDQEEVSAAPGTRVTTPLVPACQDPSPTCAACMATDCAKLPKTECLGDQTCRLALNSYRVCLGSACQDSAGDCKQALTTAEGRSRATKMLSGVQGFAECVDGTCQSACKDSALVTSCELYCACMTANCKVADAACVADCTSQKPADVLCRWTHCEMASADPTGDHCNHAKGINFCQTNTVYNAPCKDRSQDTFACTNNGDCCSNICDHHVCRAAN
jgi:hypothetical protein